MTITTVSGSPVSYTNGTAWTICSGTTVSKWDSVSTGIGDWRYYTLPYVETDVVTSGYLDIGKKDICAYCGREVEHDACDHCGAPRSWK